MIEAKKKEFAIFHLYKLYPILNCKTKKYIKFKIKTKNNVNIRFNRHFIDGKM